MSFTKVDFLWAFVFVIGYNEYIFEKFINIAAYYDDFLLILFPIMTGFHWLWYGGFSFGSLTYYGSNSLLTVCIGVSGNEN